MNRTLLIFIFVSLTITATAWSNTTTCPKAEPSCQKACTASATPEKTNCTRVAKAKTECPALKKPSCPALKKSTQPRSSCGRNTQIDILEKNGWKLVMHTLQPGTKSQGYHGELYVDGERVLGEEGETQQSPLGNLIWKGGAESRNHKWDTTGWAVEKTDAM